MKKEYQTPFVEISKFETENVLDMSVYGPAGTGNSDISPIIPIG